MKSRRPLWRLCETYEPVDRGYEAEIRKRLEQQRTKPQ